MTENRQQDTNRNAEYAKTLERLLETAKSQGKNEYVDAIEAAIKALRDAEDTNQDSRKDDLQMSATDQLLLLAAQVRSTTLSPTQRTAAAHQLMRMGGGR